MNHRASLLRGEYLTEFLFQFNLTWKDFVLNSVTLFVINLCGIVTENYLKHERKDNEMDKIWIENTLISIGLGALFGLSNRGFTLFHK